MATKANDLCPESILVEGRELYEATVLEGLNEKPRVVVESIFVRSVQMRADDRGNKKLTAFAWPKNNSTWGKRSTKTGDYGWLPSPDPDHRTKLVAGERMPLGVGATKIAALKSCLRAVLARAERAMKFNYGADIEAEIAEEKALVERRIKVERRTASVREKKPKSPIGSSAE
ncbi:hypothetical protein PZT66_24605 [Pseudomonas aeruginosa]|uniref:hypothetical protein n=1 Tax=Pseudomonas aeruginosa group TaxID=136841 RepID=UPI0005B3D8BB|nr:hypothetical protein [Pseudomonas aeruginosa]EIU2716183.1 hypothetical protein [Pseudomonas aeruginosa]EIU2863002.1 hypothetical protein [Pseudomonas aeruginosa]ELD5773035.1 hypothetical protein [Pseudomonas aeruginosa]MBA5210072.1 hypothetical protein [Pseudomonas aeruginosa]MBG3917476.1 hypothetical protein [Pseudomonas aeruginosa]